ncbi:MAG: chromophore lyase CpcT/CpeT [Cyanobacteriota bacterium]|nr:chromophore lyase CpcT/CpeT [Cyanobacteriota bacterium]
MIDLALLTTLARWLAGKFDNQAQSFAQPAWFVHLHLWHRPLPVAINGNIALFAEQASVASKNPPYRQRILELQPISSGEIRVQYWAFKEPQKFQGAGENPEMLVGLTVDALDDLPGCTLTAKWEQNRFIAQPKEGDLCYFQYLNQTRQVILGFEALEGQFKSFDRGVDPETGKGLWGALMGPYEFEKQQSYEIKT